jgi:hypothetical protein
VCNGIPTVSKGGSAAVSDLIFKRIFYYTTAVEVGQRSLSRLYIILVRKQARNGRKGNRESQRKNRSKDKKGKMQERLRII